MQSVPPGGRHYLLKFFQTTVVARHKSLPLGLVQLLKRFSELLPGHCIRGQLAIRKYAQVCIRFFPAGVFPEGKGIDPRQKPLAEPGINRFAAGLIIVMPEIKTHEIKMVARIEEPVNVGDGRPFDRESRLCPIAGRRHQDLRTGGRHCGKLHIGIFDAQPRSIFTTATALHDMRHHHDRRLRRQTIIHGAQDKSLRPAAGFSGAGQALFVHIRQ